MKSSRNLLAPLAFLAATFSSEPLNSTLAVLPTLPALARDVASFSIGSRVHFCGIMSWKYPGICGAYKGPWIAPFAHTPADMAAAAGSIAVRLGEAGCGTAETMEAMWDHVNKFSLAAKVYSEALGKGVTPSMFTPKAADFQTEMMELSDMFWACAKDAPLDEPWPDKSLYSEGYAIDGAARHWAMG